MKNLAFLETLLFLLYKKISNKWRLLTDLKKVNTSIKPINTLQPKTPSPTTIPQNWHIISNLFPSHLWWGHGKILWIKEWKIRWMVKPTTHTCVLSLPSLPISHTSLWKGASRKLLSYLCMDTLSCFFFWVGRVVFFKWTIGSKVCL